MGKRNTWRSTTGTKDYTIDMVSSAATFVGDGADAVELTGNDKSADVDSSSSK